MEVFMEMLKMAGVGKDGDLEIMPNPDFHQRITVQILPTFAPKTTKR